MITRELFASSAPLASVKMVPLPEVGEGCSAGLRKMGADKLIELRKISGTHPELGNSEFTYALLACTLCDEQGVLLFADADDLAAAFKLPVDTLERLAKDALEHSGLTAAEKN